jgi:RNase H-fold protein (predicted Holliday junction resolvase)
MTVLGISIGTVRTGVCVLQNDTILDRHIHVFDATWSENKLRIIMNRYEQYFQKYRPGAVMLKVPPSKYHKLAVAVIIKGLDRLAKKYDCMFDLITKGEIKDALCMESSQDMGMYAATLYPDLARLYEKDKGGIRNYNKKLYEAVLCAHIYKEWLRIKGLWEREKAE